MSIEYKKKKEIEDNYKEFQKLLPLLIHDKAGQVVLMKDGKVIDYFSTLMDAVIAGNLHYPDGIFSVQEIKADGPVNLGFFSTSLAA